MLKIITNFSSKDISLAKNIFLKNLSNESLIARYEIYKENNIIPKFDFNGIPIFENDIFWSISHKKNLVFVGSFVKPIGIDIEIIKNRGLEIFFLHKKEEYNIFGNKNLKNFYYLWTIKESLIKLHLSGIDKINDIKILETKDDNYNLGEIFFNKMTYSIFNDKKNITYSGKNDDFIYSISFFIDFFDLF